MPTTQTGGGTATHSGTNYQNGVAAWIAIQVLAETGATPPWGLPATVNFSFLRCETFEPVDDILVGTSSSGHAFLQAKHNLDLGTTDSSDFASVIDQFVRQFHAHSTIGNTSAWDRPLDSTTDRLVLATSPNTSARVRVTLPTVLDRLRSLLPTQSMDQAIASVEDKEVLKAFTGHVNRVWQKVKGALPSRDEFQAFAGLIRIHILDVDPGKSQEQEAQNLLRTVVLKNPAEAGQAWNTLVQACAGFAANRTGATRDDLQKLLISAGFNLRATTSYRADIQKLENWSDITLRSLEALSDIRISSTKIVKITRDSTASLQDSARQGSLVVVGQPGAGKSGALFDAAQRLKADGDVLVFAVGQFDAGSLGSIRNEIGCTHEIVDILRNWPSTKPGFVIVDALDAARTEAGASAFRDLIGSILAMNGRWRVIPSIRKFDLRYSRLLKNLFAGSPPSVYADPEFKNARHIDVPVLTDSELQQVQQQSPELGSIVQSAGVDFLKLLRVPFNLRLIAELVGAGVHAASLAPIRTQIELLERYWNERVIASDAQADARESVLQRATEEMVRSRTLRIGRDVVAGDPAASAALHQVLSSHVLVEWQPSPDSVPDRYVITYAHHILFDYAVARLMLRGPQDKLIARLSNETDLLVAVRPSLNFHFQHLWSLDKNHRRFWECVFAFFNAQEIAPTGKIIGPLAASQLISNLADCELLISELKNDSSTNHKAAVHAFRHLMGAVQSSQADANRPIAGPGAPPWCELLEIVSGI
jgi:hypothetical protein